MGSEKDTPSPFLLTLPDAGPGCTLAIEIPLDHLRHVDVGCGLNPSLLCLPDAYAQWTVCSDQRFVVTIRAGWESRPTNSLKVLRIGTGRPFAWPSHESKII